MKTIVVFGGTGGLGVKLVPYLEKRYDVIALGSKDVNVTDLKQVKKFFKEKNIDIVLNMSGRKYDVFLSKINENDVESISDMLDVNIKGNINILGSCLPQMVEKRWGRVIAISSILSILNVPSTSLYSASKAFIDKLIIVANRENIKYGVTCNSIQLGYWDGGMCFEIEEKYQKMALEKIGLKRWGSIEELYNTINYIIDNEYVCGSNLRIDGGL